MKKALRIRTKKELCPSSTYNNYFAVTSFSCWEQQRLIAINEKKNSCMDNSIYHLCNLVHSMASIMYEI